MSTLKKAGAAAASTALALGTGFAAPAAAGGGTVLADASNCTMNTVSAAANQDKPWEISTAGSLTNWTGEPLTGTGVTVAVVDTGIKDADKQLPVTGGAVLNGETGYDADDDGHGTMVASIIGARQVGDGESGMVGIAPGVNLLSMREAGCQATAGNTEDAMADAINEAVSKKADVINISQDGYDPDQKLYDAVVNAYNHGVVVVTSAGNQGDRDTTDNNGKDYGVNPLTYPASYQPYVLAVGAIDAYDSVPTFSEKGTTANPFVGVVAPGVQVEALLPNGKLVVDDGTSFAAPYVAAEAALIIEEYDWTHKADRVAARAYEVMKIIEDTADGDGSYSLTSGWGEAQISYALTKVKASSTPGGDDQDLVSQTGTGAFGPVYGLPVKMYGAGPNKDGLASSAGATGNRIVAKPYVAAASDKTAQSQQRWAYIALIIGFVVAAVTLGGAAVARDAGRRRRAVES